MTRRNVDAVVVGGGSAGMAAALRLREAGHSVAIVEREPFLGGILLQCIHSGFGLHEFGEDLTGPEYAERFIGPVLGSGIEVWLNATVMRIEGASGARRVTAFCGRAGIVSFDARAVVLAMGCRERNRGNIPIAGTRPAGVFTAGLAQRLVNVEGCIPGRRAVIVGSGDIGLIMARRLTLVGCEVLAVIEIQPYPSGIVRNIVQCLNDFSIPLYLSHVVSRIEGRDRVEAVEVTPLRDGRPDREGAFRISCDTVLLSVGLIPENELSRAAGVVLDDATAGARVDAELMTGQPGIFACGNVLHVHDLVDFVTEEARRCGERAAAWLAGASRANQLKVVAGANVRYVVPGACAPGRQNVLFLRPLVVKNDAALRVCIDGREVTARRLAHIQPSEMIRLAIEPEAIASAFPPPGSEPPGSAARSLEVSIQ
jgi:NADPH-dependent 2,4-dienoyl-CoA reductase/sulfur reductase-like enzyme